MVVEFFEEERRHIASQANDIERKIGKRKSFLLFDIAKGEERAKYFAQEFVEDLEIICADIKKNCIEGDPNNDARCFRDFREYLIDMRREITASHIKSYREETYIDWIDDLLNAESEIDNICFDSYLYENGFIGGNISDR